MGGGRGSAAGWSTQLLPTPVFRGLESALVPNLAPFCRRFGGAGGQMRGPRVSVKSQSPARLSSEPMTAGSVPGGLGTSCLFPFHSSYRHFWGQESAANVSARPDF